MFCYCLLVAEHKHTPLRHFHLLLSLCGVQQVLCVPIGCIYVYSPMLTFLLWFSRIMFRFCSFPSNLLESFSTAKLNTDVSDTSEF